MTAAVGAVSGAGESDADRAMTAMYGAHYHSLARLATLLVGDVRTAEFIVQDSFVVMHGAWPRLREDARVLSYLRRSVLRRSRSAPPHPAVRGESAVISAVRALPWRQREALLLRLYVDLRDDEIAAVMGISPAAVRDHAALGMAAVQPVLS
jgi:DNA-directed RNA polymerase specialized sigma24 family protein